MIKDITIGQYYSVDSPIHRLDPRTKLAGTLLYIISLFIADGPFAYLLAFGFLALVVYCSKVPYRYMMRGLKSILFILFLSAAFNLFLTPGTVLVEFWIFKITWEGILKAIYMSIRLLLLIMGSTIMTLTTTPNSLTDGLEKSLGFLNKIKVPVHEISMMMSIALRFIPILIEETDKIMNAQKARGADFESGNIFKKIKAMIPLLVPLFISAFRRASDLAMAMEARCYHGGANRTKMKPLQYHKMDGRAYISLFAYVIAGIVLSNLW